jgi:hypothetical protein
MAETFSCPECSAPVEVTGLAPGRQVRCKFCHRLLEVPYLPRVLKAEWKRSRFGRPWWVVWAWASLGLAAVVIVLIAVSQMLIRHEKESLDRSIGDLVASSEVAESEGDLTRALVDLDSAIGLRASAPGGALDQLETMRQRRLVLNRREANSVLDRLKGRDAGALPLGDWLNLQARVDADRELAALTTPVRQALKQKLTDRIDFLLTGARAALAAGKPAEALANCDSSWGLLKHLPPDEHRGVRTRLEPIVDQVVAQHGIVVDPIKGQTLSDRRAPDNSRLMPVVNRALTARGYVPQPGSSPWRDRWAKAPYKLVLELNERYDGTYLSSENRLTRIDARLVLLQQGRQFWETSPGVRTPVPLPKLPAYVSGHLALSTKRNKEFEQLLYENARNSIDDKVAFSLDHMPACMQSKR